ncbi:hypothetical protein D3C76_1622940 [compost metagenome]
MEKRPTSLWKLPSISSAVPIRLPAAKLIMNSTGNELSFICVTAALIPSSVAAKPIAVNSAV